MSYLTKLRTLASKTEATPGTIETLGSGDNNNRVWDLQIGSIDVPMDVSPSKVATGDFGNGEMIPGPQSATVSFTVKPYAETTLKTEPSYTKFLKSAGCSVQAFNDGTGSGFIVYPDKVNVENTITLGIYDINPLVLGAGGSGLYYQFKGGIANCTVSTEGTGKPYQMKFDYTTACNDVTDIAEASIPGYSGISAMIPDRFLAGSGSIGNDSVCISTMEFNFGNTITPIQCQNASSGFDKFCITEMNPTLKINPKVQDSRVYDWFGNWTAGTVERVAIGTSMFELVWPRCQITNAPVVDDAGVLRNDIEFSVLRPTEAHVEAGYAPWYILIKSTDTV